VSVSRTNDLITHRAAKCAAKEIPMRATLLSSYPECHASPMNVAELWEMLGDVYSSTTIRPRCEIGDASSSIGSKDSAQA
jgi:hypothetical protein